MKNILEVSWNDFFVLSNDLIRKLPHNYFNLIICINSGGLILGKLTKDNLSIPLAVITAESYQNGETEKKTKHITIGTISTVVPIKGTVLLIDDLVDSGYTMESICNELHDKYKVKDIQTAVIYKKTNSVLVPDYFVEETDKWIVFPYEQNEFDKIYINCL